MPYILKSDRRRLDPEIEKLALDVRSWGDINYIITRILKIYIQRIGKCYENLNACIGVLECAKSEFYRRYIAPYEDTKIQENGDVKLIDLKKGDL